MGVRSHLVEGVSGTGKTWVCEELVRRGHHAIQVVRLHRTQEDVPGSGIVIDATAPLAEVVEEILSHVSDPP